MKLLGRREAGGETIIGLVSPEGAGLSHSKGDKHWKLRVRLEAWRRPGEPLDDRTVTLIRYGSKDALWPIWKRLGAYEVVRLTTRLSASGEGQLVEVHGPDGDEDLNRRSAELQVPVTREVAPFGLLTLDRRLDWWEAPVQWLGADMTISLEPGDEELNVVARWARHLWDAAAEWDDRVRSFFVSELLDLCNEWQEGRGPAVTADEFRRRPTVESVTIRADGTFEFWFEDDGLFMGHQIIVCGSIAAGPTRADI